MRVVTVDERIKDRIQGLAYDMDTLSKSMEFLSWFEVEMRIQQLVKEAQDLGRAVGIEHDLMVFEEEEHTWDDDE